MQKTLNHLAIIMDGNYRWAKENNKTAADGHHMGAENAKNILQYALKHNIKYLTLFAFSSENWQRPVTEISTIISLLKKHIDEDKDLLNENGIKLKIIGDLSKLPSSLVNKIEQSTNNTQNNNKMTLAIAFSYGSRNEIVQACQNIIDSGIKKITEKKFKQFLYDPNMPDVDILIRTSGVHRISNFLLWQLYYAELYFLEKLWPDFNKKDLDTIINNYYQRTRRFGKRNDR